MLDERTADRHRKPVHVPKASVSSLTECDVSASQAAAALNIFSQLRRSSGLIDTLKDEQRIVY